jgi:gas vesicle protein
MISQESLTLILFNATINSISAIEDKNYKREAKKWLELWRKQGNQLWKEIKRNTNDLPEALNTYEELAAEVYEVVQKHLKENYGNIERSA